MKIRKPSVRQNAKRQRQQKLDEIVRREIEEESGSLPGKSRPLIAPILVLTQNSFRFRSSTHRKQMEIGHPVTSCEQNRQESFRRLVPTTYRTLLRRSTYRARRPRGRHRPACQIQGVERRPRHRDFARKAVAMTQHLNAMLVRMFKRQSVYAKRK
jgi:hypothetical protein